MLNSPKVCSIVNNNVPQQIRTTVTEAHLMGETLDLTIILQVYMHGIMMPAKQIKVSSWIRTTNGPLGVMEFLS